LGLSHSRLAEDALYDNGQGHQIGHAVLHQAARVKVVQPAAATQRQSRNNVIAMMLFVPGKADIAPVASWPISDVAFMT